MGVGGRGGLGTCTCAVCVGVMKVFYVKALVQLSYSVALLCNTLVSYPGFRGRSRVGGHRDNEVGELHVLH